jgi:glucose/arabinose dehydrogenase
MTAPCRRSTSAACLKVCLLLLAAAPAAAALAPALTGRVVVDTAWLGGATQPTDIAFAADGRAVITQKGGAIRVRRADGSVNVVPYPFGGTLDTASEKGLLGVVADPAVAQNNAFYFYVSNGPTADKHRVYRATLTAADTFVVDPTPVIAASRGLGPGLEGPANHDGGGMVIHDGKLYVAVGDTGANASPPQNKYGSCLNKGNGKILRVNLDGTVPADNPLVGLASVTACTTPTGAWTTGAPDLRIYAWGFRNPWRMWVDPATGLMWIGDVGEVSREEISVGTSGKHFGYPFEEGDRIWGALQAMNCNTMTPARPCTAPAFAYDRTQGQAITGGLIPDTPAWAQVFGSTHYVWADSSAGWLRSLPVNAARSGFAATVPTEFAAYAGGAPVSLRMGPDGALYVVMLGFGAVYRFTPLMQPGVTQTVPTLPPAAMLGLLAVLALLGAAVARRR